MQVLISAFSHQHGPEAARVPDREPAEILGWPLQLAALGAMVWVLGRNQTPIDTPSAPAP